jgi:SAM-dependent methyltransferase
LFEHLHDPSPFIAKVYELLKPGGYFLFTTLNSLGFDIQVLWQNSKSIFPPNHLNFFTPYSMELFLKKWGFSMVEITTPGQLDWDIVEGIHREEGVDPGRFFCTVSRYGTDEAKRCFQEWIQQSKFSSHMRTLREKNNMAGKKLRVGIAGYGVVGKRRRQCIDLNDQIAHCRSQ